MFRILSFFVKDLCEFEDKKNYPRRFVPNNDHAFTHKLNKYLRY